VCNFSIFGKKLMKKKALILGFMLFIGMNCFAQEEKTNPIVYAEIIIGYSNGSSKGVTGGATFNYQKNKNLFSYRFLEITENRKDGSFFGIPNYIKVEEINEHALMYGRRFVDDNTSYSFSAGIAHVDREFLIDDTNGVLKYDNTQSIGFPFELNIKWFNAKKEPFRIYEMIPVGKPTSFANSIGFKFYGNVSKTSFVGLGITFGLGWHKNY
jgi:hypothetical protein